MTDILKWNQLRRPFAPSQIKKREGKKGMWYDYVPNATVVERLNEQEDLRWDFTVKYEIIGNEVLVLGTMKIEEEIKEAFGSCTYSTGYIGDALKTAQAGALTKVASLFGIPCVFNTRKKEYMKQNHTQTNQQQYNKPTNNFNNQTVPYENEQTQQNEQQVCNDCKGPISQQEIQFCNNNSRLKGQKVCRKCQQERRKRGA
ncbi:hypothetical protein SAMN05518871_109152 [Psychrobacillus sp. OK028]|uniref:hypothetical protein n=1 Tax=Psychrobacillus sp. OK028 TaxID=1884359 RepID=UPI0008816D83|nr:hypothetical protein [Psychrobacillus sp. OK028]SDO03201.1 hypothetical protein SAMN05518871_109152 [Psychrobacillus sp. OK028]